MVSRAPNWRRISPDLTRFRQIGDRGWNPPDVDAAPDRFPGSVRARSARAVRCMYPSSSRAQLSSRAGGLGAAQGRLSGACGSSPIWANWRRPVLGRRLQFGPAVSKLETAGKGRRKCPQLRPVTVWRGGRVVRCGEPHRRRRYSAAGTAGTRFSRGSIWMDLRPKPLIRADPLRFAAR